MAFTGWKADALEFFDRLEEENTKAFWERNKTTYDTLVRAPMDELVSELEKEWGKGHVFRPYRDVRFSNENPCNRPGPRANEGATLGQP